MDSLGDDAESDHAQAHLAPGHGAYPSAGERSSSGAMLAR